MKLRVFIGLVAVALIAGAIALYFRHHVREVSMILTNTRIYTMNPSQPRADAMAINNGIIVGVGSAEEIAGKFKADTVIDLRGKPVYPGFIDSHAHFEALGVMMMNLNVEGMRTPEEVAHAVAEAVAKRPQGAWIRGRGWDQNLWSRKEFPSHEILDRAAPHNSVMLARRDGHAVWVNSAVLALAHIQQSTKDPPGGKVIRDRQGNPTGVLVDNAMQMLSSFLPPPTREERKEAIRTSLNECLKLGLTQIHDMGVDDELINIYREMMKGGGFPLRVYAAIDGTGETWRRLRTSGPEKGNADDRLTVRALKVYMDGALGSRGAALLQPYTDEAGERGLTLMSSDSLRKLAGECIEKGFQLCVHAIGDRANDIVLKAYGNAFDSTRTNGNDVRFRIEHAQVLDPGDVPRFHALGIIPVMQASQCTSDMLWVENRLGARTSHAYLWRSLIDDGNIVPGGSDFPVESPNPLLGFYAAITRQTTSGDPRGGWHPEQCMTREEALKSYTIWGSYAAFEEDVKGSLEVGKWADLVVLSDDIMSVDVQRIPEISVERTMIGGSFVFEAANENAVQAAMFGEVGKK